MFTRQSHDLQVEWSSEELERLKEVFGEVESEVVEGEGVRDVKEILRAVAARFPRRGVREVTQQLREVGLIAGGGGAKSNGDRGNEKRKSVKCNFLRGLG